MRAKSKADRVPIGWGLGVRRANAAGDHRSREVHDAADAWGGAPLEALSGTQRRATQPLAALTLYQPADQLGGALLVGLRTEVLRHALSPIERLDCRSRGPWPTTPGRIYRPGLDGQGSVVASSGSNTIAVPSVLTALSNPGGFRSPRGTDT